MSFLIQNFLNLNRSSLIMMYCVFAVPCGRCIILGKTEEHFREGFSHSDYPGVNLMSPFTLKCVSEKKNHWIDEYTHA